MAVTPIDRMTAANISSRTRRTMPVDSGPTKEDNEVMGEMGKRETVNSRERRCIESPARLNPRSEKNRVSDAMLFGHSLEDPCQSRFDFGRCSNTLTLD